MVNYSKRIVCLGLLDASTISLAVVLAYLLRFDFQVPTPYFIVLPFVILMHLVYVLFFLKGFNLYRRLWEYASIEELVSLIKATTIAECITFSFYLLISNLFPLFLVPRSIFLLSWSFIILGVGGSRLFWRIVRDSIIKPSPRNNQRNVLIVGAGTSGTHVVKELKRSCNSELIPVAFIDDMPTKHNIEIMGLPVYGRRETIRDAVKKFNISDIVIAIPSAPKSEIAKIIEICKHTKANIKILPSVKDLITGKVCLEAIREVRVEDLLGREPVNVDLDQIAGYITNQVVLVTGAGGSIGSELCRQLLYFSPKKLLLLGHGENSIYEIELELKKKFSQDRLETIIADIQDRARMEEIFGHYRPAVVFHAAAHKHVPLMEKNPSEAVKNNVFGTKNVAECAHKYGATHFVLISTDKAVNPSSVMGTSKRVAEMIVQGLDRVSLTKFVAVRFGNVLGSRGSVIPVFKQQIQEGGPLTVTHPDMVRYFMTIPEAVQLVIQAGGLAKGGEIFILDMGSPVKISDLARDLIRLSGFIPDQDIQIEYSGIRPGEKLFEEMLTAEEGTTVSKHDRIFVGKSMTYSWEDLQHKIHQLEDLITSNSIGNRSDKINLLLHSIVPVYRKLTLPLNQSTHSEVKTLHNSLVN